MGMYSGVPRGESGFFKGVNPASSILSISIILIFIFFTITNTELCAQIFAFLQSWIQSTLGWYYILCATLFLWITVYLIFSRFGDIRLGRNDEDPEFSYFSWIAMLFGAGMGIGVLFWSVSEPIYHFQGNPRLEPGTEGSISAANTAIQFVFLHWGLHQWSIYTITALGLAYFAYRKGLSLTIRSTLYPILGDRINGWAGLSVDILAIFSTLFGICTTLGAGAGQINAGLDYLFGIEQNIANQILIILVISIIAILSVMSGLKKGIKYLSQMNVWLSIFLLIVFLFAGPTVFLISFVLTNFGEYLANVVPLGFWVDSDPKGEWQGAWTVFYYGWTMSWAPFVGMFIARISRGRTIREFCLGVLIIPALICILWFGVFGGTALYMALFENNGLVSVVEESISKPIFFIIENMGLEVFTWLTAMIALLLIVSYFVTSSDSGTLVITTIISIGDPEPNRYYRMFWGLAEALAAIALLLAGGLDALKTAAMAAGLPFSFIILLMVYGLYKSFREELLNNLQESSADR